MIKIKILKLIFFSDFDQRHHERDLRGDVRLLLRRGHVGSNVLLAVPCSLYPAGNQDFSHRALGSGSGEPGW